jgi:hypothetical protein
MGFNFLHTPFLKFKWIQLPSKLSFDTERTGFIYTAYTVYISLCPNDDIWKEKGQSQKKGKDKRQINSLPTPICS